MDTELKQLVGAAEEHGRQSEAEHEVGDLQEILVSCWSMLSPRDRRKVFDEHKHLIEEWVEGDEPSA